MGTMEFFYKFLLLTFLFIAINGRPQVWQGQSWQGQGFKAKVCKAKVGKAKVCKAKVCKAKVGEVNQTLEIEILSILEHLMVATQEPSVDNIIMVHKEAVNIIMGDREILSLLTIYGMAIQEPSVESDL